jgi:hypothetical protein
MARPFNRLQTNCRSVQFLLFFCCSYEPAYAKAFIRLLLEQAISNATSIDPTVDRFDVHPYCTCAELVA